MTSAGVAGSGRGVVGAFARLTLAGAGLALSAAAAFADGVIVGSAFVRCLLDSPDAGGVAAVRVLATELAAGVRR